MLSNNCHNVLTFMFSTKLINIYHSFKYFKSILGVVTFQLIEIPLFAYCSQFNCYLFDILQLTGLKINLFMCLCIKFTEIFEDYCSTTNFEKMLLET